MCEVLKASRSGFYRWMKVQWGYANRYERYLTFKIREVHEQSRRVYGSRRITHVLRSVGVRCYQNQVAKIMQREGIKAKTKRKFRLTTDSGHNMAVAANLLDRKFIVEKMNMVWVGDITYIWTLEGWVYLSTVIDLFSRKVIGWSIGKRITRELVIKSFEMAVKLRKPGKVLIFHSDRGAQYASNEFKAVLNSIGATQRMSRKGNCWDNSVAESFFKTIKSELIYWITFKTRAEAELRIFEYIEIFYNRQRLHSTLNYMSPEAFELLKFS
jgi:putative transposase